MRIQNSNGISILSAILTLAFLSCGISHNKLQQPSSDVRDHTSGSGGTSLRYNDYKVAFTNPQCQTYSYTQPVYAENGDRLYSKPQNAYCKRSDVENSVNGTYSPQRLLLEWIDDSSTKEIFFGFLSFSNFPVYDALCDAIRNRSLKLSMVLDSQTNLSTANRLAECVPSNRPDLKPKLYLRGHENDVGYAHNKFFIANPSSRTMRIAFGSGNLTTGLSTNHENWHFITLPSDTYFAQVHLCLRDAYVYDGSTIDEFSSAIDSCRRDIDYPEENDIKVFLVPGEGDKALEAISAEAVNAGSIDLAAHRFYLDSLVETLSFQATNYDKDIRAIYDDDIYWAGNGKEVGPNVTAEAFRVKALLDAGASVRYIETNHGSFQLQHNKFIIFNPPNGIGSGKVFTGAGNFTLSAFTDNFENYYMIAIPQVYSLFKQQYDRMWYDLGTHAGRMPEDNILP